jgi:hypothetical protein
MSVYVDPLVKHGPGSYHGPRSAQAERVGARNGHWWCHLFADTEAELHAFADKLGLELEWFQGDHYDLTPWRRVKAVELGALQVPTRELARRRLAKRWGCNPDG